MTNNIAEMAAEIKRLANEYAHCYSFVGDDTMPIKKRELESAIDRLEAAAQRREPTVQGCADRPFLSAPAQKPAEPDELTTWKVRALQAEAVIAKFMEPDAAPSEALARAMELADEYAEEHAEEKVDVYIPPGRDDVRADATQHREALRLFLSQYLRAPGEDTEDAARYRWMKENGEVNFREHQWFHTASGHLIHSTRPTIPELDAAIDAARTTKPEA